MSLSISSSISIYLIYQYGRADAMMDEHKVEFEKRWQQEVVRLKTEQAVYNDQVIIMMISVMMVSMVSMVVVIMRMI